jgi:uracil-DNA glycosylase
MTVRTPAAPAPAAPAPGCGLCPRLARLRDANRARFPTWHNAPVPSFGGLDARLLVVGLGPGLRGANRSGRPFTGDYAGDLLYATLATHGFARGRFDAPRDDAPWRGDDLALVDARVTNAVRCVPPENKPQPAEIRACNGFLRAEFAAMPRLEVAVALGRVAHEAVLSALGARRADFPFAHGAIHRIGGGPALADSFHCSRYNTSTRRLTPAMFDAVFAAVRRLLDAG